MIQYQVLLTCEDEVLHLTRGTQVDEDQLSPIQIDRWTKLGVIVPLDASSSSEQPFQN